MSYELPTIRIFPKFGDRNALIFLITITHDKIIISINITYNIPILRRFRGGISSDENQQNKRKKRRLDKICSIISNITVQRIQVKIFQHVYTMHFNYKNLVKTNGLSIIMYYSTR